MNYKLSKSFLVYVITVFIAAYLFGSNISAGGYDMGMHYALVQHIYKEFSQTGGYIGNMGEMVSYPPFVHFQAAFLNKFTGSGILSMQLISLFYFGLGWYVISKLVIKAGGLAFFILFSVIFLITLGEARLPLYGMEVKNGNYFFAQMACTAILLYALHYLYANKYRPIILLFISIIIFSLSLYIHTSFPIIFLLTIALHCSALIFKKTQFNFINLKNYLPIIIFLIVGGIIFRFHPYVQISLEMKTHNGMLGFSSLTTNGGDITFSGILFIYLSFVISIASFVYINLISKINNSNNDCINFFSTILFSSTSICLLQYILFKLNINSIYIPKKNFFVIFTLIVVIFSLYLNLIILKYNFIPKLHIKNEYAFLVIPFIFILLVLRYWTVSDTNFYDVKKLQDVAIHYKNYYATKDITNKTVANFKNINDSMNFLISVGDLELERGDVSFAYLHKGLNELPAGSFVLSDTSQFKDKSFYTFGEYKVYSTEQYKQIPLLKYNEYYSINSKSELSESVLRIGFSRAENFGVWTNSNQAIINFKTLHKFPHILELTLRGWIVPGHDKVIADVYANELFQNKLILTNNELYKYTLKLPSDDDYKIRFEIKDAKSPKELGISGDERRISFGIIGIKIIDQ